MKTLSLKKSTASLSEKCNLMLKSCIALFFFSMITPVSPASAQTVLFDFNSAPLYSPLPIDLAMGGITAHFSATGGGYSIQNANTMGFTPAGFDGRCIYPSNINLSDLLISFDKTLTDFSILYSCQELGCDDAATMRVTAKMNDSFVGTNTKIASQPGTWPTDTLKCSFPQGFNNVVVHYDHRPPTCQDYGVIYLADNMQVTAFNATAIVHSNILREELIFPNLVSSSATISFSISQPQNIHVSIYDITGRLVKDLFNGVLNTGAHQIPWDVNDDEMKSGVYFMNLSGENFSRSCKLVVVK